MRWENYKFSCLYIFTAEILQVGLNNATGCSKENSGAEDVEMGKCMEALNVVAGDSRDPMGRGRFFPFVPEHHLIPGHVNKDFWYWQYIYYESKEVGLELSLELYFQRFSTLKYWRSRILHLYPWYDEQCIRNCMSPKSSWKSSISITSYVLKMITVCNSYSYSKSIPHIALDRTWLVKWERNITTWLLWR